MNEWALGNENRFGRSTEGAHEIDTHALMLQLLEGSISSDSLDHLNIHLNAHGCGDRTEGINFHLLTDGSRVGDIIGSLSVGSTESFELRGETTDQISEVELSEEEVRLELESVLRREVTLIRSPLPHDSLTLRACGLLAMAIRLDEVSLETGHAEKRLFSEEQVITHLNQFESFPNLTGGSRYSFLDDDAACRVELQVEVVENCLVVKLLTLPDINQMTFGFCLRSPGMFGGGEKPRIRNAMTILAIALSIENNERQRSSS